MRPLPSSVPFHFSSLSTSVNRKEVRVSLHLLCSNELVPVSSSLTITPKGDSKCFLVTSNHLLRKLRVSQNMVFRRLFGPRRYEVTEEWRRLHSEELNDLYSSPNIVRVMKWRRMGWVGHVARMGEERGAYRVLVGKPEGKRPVGRPRRRWVDNNRMDLQEVGCGYVDWIGLAQDRDRWRTVVSAVMNLWVP